ncbi:hypothetical protein [Amycolatopsis australiensis]|uniref:Uncharacterized protein n=1 Tax=Amycolatopsis australiensis TaxID=546364 RepID=A0A1K1SB13_9PSEU|nr:hypothetical protein [Amycolatopsis australiensis]SFW81560.1 hypothetical protein SAMN04489730_5226 [Amycolatopsis australiensis]
MNGVLTSVIAVCGTLAGSTLTYLFARLTARRAEKAARDERLRQERITAYAAFAGAITTLRQKVIALWFLKQRGADTQSAHAEADRCGAAADHARFEVRLLTEDPELRRLADAAFGPIAAIGDAADHAEVRAHEHRSQEILTAFVQAAGRQLR